MPQTSPQQLLFLACLAKLPTGLYILLVLISFFFLFLYFLIFNDFSETNYVRIRGTIFAIFSPNERVLGADDQSGPLFSIFQGTLPWQPIL